MPVSKPSARLATDVPLRAVQMRLRGQGRRAVYADLILTPMIDFLVVVVVFLLGTFSASGEFISIQKGLELPGATQTHELERAPIIAVTKDIVTLDGKLMADVWSILTDKSTEGMKIDKLVEELDILRRNWVAIHPGQQFTGTVVLQADRGVDFRVIKRAMFSAGEAGYTNLNLAVKIVGKT